MGKFIDLFAGAGGLSEGFIRAGFEPIAHVEMNRNACETIKTRTAFHKLKKRGQTKIYESYLKDEISREELHNYLSKDELKSIINKEISSKSIDDIFKTIDELKGNNDVDFIIGGPPCQAYSVIGRARDSNNMKNDPRNHLYKYYVAFLKKYSPKMFVFENVPGILSANNGGHLRKILKTIKKSGYNYNLQILLSSDFGVLQNRRRVIIIGWRKDIDFELPEFEKNSYESNLKKFILEDLPVSEKTKSPLRSRKDIQSKNLVLYKHKPNNYLIETKIRNGENFTTQHKSRFLNNNDYEIYKTVVQKWFKEGKHINYDELPKKLIRHKNLKSFKNRFKIVRPDQYSQTIVAHMKNDGHHYIYPDLEQIRSLTVREAARIQSFPDNYFFEGGQGAAFAQIGNAVPPLMGEKIAIKLIDKLKKVENC